MRSDVIMFDNATAVGSEVVKPDGLRRLESR